MYKYILLIKYTLQCVRALWFTRKLSNQLLSDLVNRGGPLSDSIHTFIIANHCVFANKCCYFKWMLPINQKYDHIVWIETYFWLRETPRNWVTLFPAAFTMLQLLTMLILFYLQNTYRSVESRARTLAKQKKKIK